MAAITEAQAKNIVDRAVIILNEYEKYLTEDNGDDTKNHAELRFNFLVHHDALIDAAQFAELIGGTGTQHRHKELEDAVRSSLSAFRRSLVGIKSQAAALLAPPLRILAKHYGFQETSPQDIIGRMFQYYVDTGRRIKSRGLTFGSVSPGKVSGGSNTGSGTVYYRSTMVTGDPIENVWPETVELRCISDEHTGATEHREVFSIRGAAPYSDNLLHTGSGESDTITALSGSDSLALNSSFTNYTGTAGDPTLTNWTLTGGGTAKFDMETGAGLTYRDSNGEATPTSLKWVTQGVITQAFSVRNLNFSTNTPYFWHIAYKAPAGVTGNLKVKIGGETVNIKAFDGDASTAWLVFTGTTYFDNFNEEDPEFEISISDLSGSGPVYIDDFIFAPMQFFNGLPIAVVGGATPFLKDDRFTYAVSEPATKVGLVNEWLWKAYGLYLPAEASPAATNTDWSDPTDYA